jgi:hypothetical protein
MTSITSYPKTGTKKGPGRPRKTPIADNDPKNGISLTPIQPTNILEFYYDQPKTFKNTLTPFDMLECTYIQFLFEKDRIEFYGVVHNNTTELLYTFNVSKCNHYYIKEPFEAGFSSNNIRLLASMITNHHVAIHITCEADAQRQFIMFHFINNNKTVESCSVNMSDGYPRKSDDSNQKKFDLSLYPVSILFPCSILKSQLSSMNLITKDIFIEACASEFSIKAITDSRKVSYQFTITPANAEYQYVFNETQIPCLHQQLTKSIIQPITTIRVAPTMVMGLKPLSNCIIWKSVFDSVTSLTVLSKST